MKKVKVAWLGQDYARFQKVMDENLEECEGLPGQDGWDSNMRTPLSRIVFFWEPDVEFTTSLSINTRRNRLEDLGATADEVRWF